MAAQTTGGAVGSLLGGVVGGATGLAVGLVSQEGSAIGGAQDGAALGSRWVGNVGQGIGAGLGKTIDVIGKTGAVLTDYTPGVGHVKAAVKEHVFGNTETAELARSRANISFAAVAETGAILSDYTPGVGHVKAVVKENVLGNTETAELTRSRANNVVFTAAAKTGSAVCTEVWNITCEDVKDFAVDLACFSTELTFSILTAPLQQ